MIAIAKKTIKKTKVLIEDKVLTEDQIKILNNLKKAKIAAESKKNKVEAESKKKKVKKEGNFFDNLFGIRVKKNKVEAEDVKKPKQTLEEKRRNNILADLKSLANDKKILAKSLKLSAQTEKRIKND